MFAPKRLLHLFTLRRKYIRNSVIINGTRQQSLKDIERTGTLQVDKYKRDVRLRPLMSSSTTAGTDTTQTDLDIQQMSLNENTSIRRNVAQCAKASV